MPGGENIIKNSQLCSNRDTWISGGTPLASEFTTKEGFDCIHITGQLQKYFALTPYYTVNTTRYLGIQANGNIYTLSFDVLFDNVVKGTTNYYVTFYKSGETIDGTWRNPSIISNSGHFTSATSDNLDPVKLNGKGWQRVYITIQFGNYAWANSNYVFQLYLRDFLGDVYIKNAKVELGDHATPWIPNPADPLYSSLGFNDGIEYDVSGYGNNGTRNGTFSWSGDTPRYNTSTYVNSSSSIDHPRCLSNDDQEWTCCAWVKLDSLTRHQQLNNFNFGNMVVYATTPILYLNEGSDDYYMYGSQVIPVDEWIHIAFVFKNSTGLRNIYINGILKNNYGPNKTSTPSGIPDSVTLFGQNFAGYVSDYREYATALSSDDVRDLYSVAASISDNGTLMASEVSEL